MFNNTQVGHDANRRKHEFKILSNNCSMYDPCPICFKCMNKATHLYQKCNDCPLMHCAHNHKQRAWMIRRENFAIDVTKETGEAFKKAAEACECHGEG